MQYVPLLSAVLGNIPRTQFFPACEYQSLILFSNFKKKYSVGVYLTMREGDLEWLGGVSEVPQCQAAV